MIGVFRSKVPPKASETFVVLIVLLLVPSCKWEEINPTEQRAPIEVPRIFVAIRCWVRGSPKGVPPAGRDSAKLSPSAAVISDKL